MMRTVPLTIAILLSTSAGFGASTLYTITDLGYLPGANSAQASSINNAGMVVGSYSSSSSNEYGFVWTPAAGLAPLPTFGGAEAIPTRVNSSGQVTGFGDAPGNQSTAAFLYSDGTVQNLGALPGDCCSVAYGINDSGDVTGYSFGASNLTTGILYKNGALVSIGPGEPSAINNSGVIVGNNTINGCSYAFVWSNALMSQLPDYGFCRGNHAPGSFAAAINDSGQITGSVSTPDFLQHAVLWPNNSAFVDLGTCPGSNGYGAGINNAGQIVGNCSIEYGPSIAVLYTAGVMYDLNTLVVNGSGWVLEYATAINDKGQIVGNGYKTVDDSHRAFLLTPVPSTPYAFSPAVSGLTQSAANTAITGAGLMPGTVQVLASNSVPAETVISGSPVAGVQVAAGSAVSLVVSNGPSSAPPPSCQLTGTVNGPPRQIQITVQDTISGLQSIQVVEAINSSVTFSAFTPGTTSPVMVTATKVDQTQSSSVTLSNTNVTGIIGSCDPVDFTATIENIRETHMFGNLSSAEHYIRIVNAKPGLRSIKFEVNGTAFRTLTPANGETRILDIGSAMQSGSDNRVVMEAMGRRGSSATILIGDASVE